MPVTRGGLLGDSGLSSRRRGEEGALNPNVFQLQGEFVLLLGWVCGFWAAARVTGKILPVTRGGLLGGAAEKGRRTRTCSKIACAIHG